MYRTFARYYTVNSTRQETFQPHTEFMANNLAVREIAPETFLLQRTTHTFSLISLFLLSASPKSHRETRIMFKQFSKLQLFLFQTVYTINYFNRHFLDWKV